MTDWRGAAGGANGAAEATLARWRRETAPMRSGSGTCLICATGRTADEMLARCASSHERSRTELRVAAQEQQDHTARLDRLVVS